MHSYAYLDTPNTARGCYLALSSHRLPFMAAPVNDYGQLRTASVPARLLYSVEDAAGLLSLGRTTVYGLIKNEALPSVLIGGKRLLAHEDLVAYVDQLRAGAQPYADTA